MSQQQGYDVRNRKWHQCKACKRGMGGGATPAACPGWPGGPGGGCRPPPRCGGNWLCCCPTPWDRRPLGPIPGTGVPAGTCCEEAMEAAGGGYNRSGHSFEWKEKKDSFQCYLGLKIVKRCARVYIRWCHDISSAQLTTPWACPAIAAAAAAGAAPGPDGSPAPAAGTGAVGAPNICVTPGCPGARYTANGCPLASIGSSILYPSGRNVLKPNTSFLFPWKRVETRRIT